MALKQANIKPILARVTITVIGDGSVSSVGRAETVPNTKSNTFAFQYWPESLTDNKQINYASTEVPGASHPLYQFVSGGERTIGFSAVFSDESDPLAQERAQESGSSDWVYSIDIRAAVGTMRSFMYPHYERKAGDDLWTRPPDRLLLSLPGTGLGNSDVAESDTVPCIMTQCDVDYRAWHPNGRPRLVQIGLVFSEIVHGPSGIRYADNVIFSGLRRRFASRIIGT